MQVCVYFYGLCKSRIAVADYYGNRDDFCITIDFPLLVFNFYPFNKEMKELGIL